MPYPWKAFDAEEARKVTDAARKTIMDCEFLERLSLIQETAENGDGSHRFEMSAFAEKNEYFKEQFERLGFKVEEKQMPSSVAEVGKRYHVISW